MAILWEHRFYGDSLPFPINVRELQLWTLRKNLISNTTSGQYHGRPVEIPYYRTSAPGRSFLRKLVPHQRVAESSSSASICRALGLARRILSRRPGSTYASQKPGGHFRCMGVFCTCAIPGGYVFVLQGRRTLPYSELLS